MSLSDIMRGSDLDRQEEGACDGLDRRNLNIAMARAPCAAGAVSGGYRGGKEAFVRGRFVHRRVAAPMPRKPIYEVGFAPPGARLRPRPAVPVVTTGFGGYIPYTAVAAVTSGAWDFIPVFAGLRVAMPASAVRAMAQAGSDPSLAGRAIARDPAMYGYVLHNDTYVPSTLSAGDRQLLSAGK